MYTRISVQACGTLGADSLSISEAFSKKLVSLAASALLNHPSHLFSCIMVTRTLSETDCSKNRSLK